ncbi:ribosome biogenesis protein bms1-like [Papaver somniferum]|uniref:ribosome biogenesis protein bms1-like n=1 Tax=Papaver somniferum TaxID=3469 RepID=UPI000E701F5F|nr:ribosome biogenesis protein bms1-like [Papaver somniferum]
MAGPIRILAGGKRRIQFVGCPNNVNGMIDAAKYADAVIFVVDAGYGFEMETFEFLELLKVHGMPKVMGVLTYLDTFRNKTMLANTQ